MATIRIIGVINEAVETAVLEKIDKLKEGEALRVELNSPGGSVFAGFSIYNKLNDIKDRVTLDIIGLAASAATFLLGAAKEVNIRRNGKVMIHNPSTFSGGDSKTLESESRNLKDLENDMTEMYAAKTGISKEEIRDMMNKETWFTAKEALKRGFVDKIIDKASESMKAFVGDFKSLGYVNMPRFEYTYLEAIENDDFESGDVIINGNIYPLTKEKIQMVNQFTNLAGVDSPEKALAYFTQLKTDISTKEAEIAALKADSGKEYLSKIVNLETEIQTLKADGEAKKSLLDSVTKKFEQDELKNRESVLTTFMSEFRIDAAQLETAKKAYVEVESASGTQALFDNYVQTIKSMPVRADLKALMGSGVASDGGNPTGQSDWKVMDAGQLERYITKTALALVDGDKVKNFSDAYSVLSKSQPELIKKYEGN